jgi:hypothetical protein
MSGTSLVVANDNSDENNSLETVIYEFVKLIKDIDKCTTQLSQLCVQLSIFNRKQFLSDERVITALQVATFRKCSYELEAFKISTPLNSRKVLEIL